MENELMEKELVIELIPYLNINVKDLQSKIQFITKNYNITKIKETLPSTGNGTATKYLVEEFMKDKLVQGLSKKTLRQYLLAIQKLYEFSKKEVTLVTKEDLVNYLNYYRYSNPKGEQKPNTVKNRYLTLSSFFTWLYKNNYISQNPFDNINTPKGTIPKKQIITPSEIEQIIIACEQKRKGIKLARDLALIQFLLETGVRCQELTEIKIEDVDWIKMKVIIHHGKGDKSRTVYFGERSKERLFQYLSYRKYTNNDYLFAQYYNNKKLQTSGILRVIKNIGEYSNIPRLHPHLFRTTFATNLIQKGVSALVVKELMGHANLQTLNSYVQLNENDIVSAISSMY